MRIAYVLGARPNFVKMAPVIAELRKRMPDGRHTIVHTGQHYDKMMSDVFLEELGVPAPDHMLGVGSASHAVQTARVAERIEPVLEPLRNGYDGRIGGMCANDVPQQRVATIHARWLSRTETENTEASILGRIRAGRAGSTPMGAGRPAPRLSGVREQRRTGRYGPNIRHGAVPRLATAPLDPSPDGASC
jgi:UDP-N-acetylglucosamine 2-epimerase